MAWWALSAARTWIYLFPILLAMSTLWAQVPISEVSAGVFSLLHSVFFLHSPACLPAVAHCWDMLSIWCALSHHERCHRARQIPAWRSDMLCTLRKRIPGSCWALIRAQQYSGDLSVLPCVRKNMTKSTEKEALACTSAQSDRTWVIQR